MPFPNNNTVVTVNEGFGISFVTFLSFCLLNWIISFLGIPPVIEKHAVDKEDEAWKWRNLTLSWIHALIVGIWDLSCFFYHPEIWQDLVSHISPFTYYMVAVSTGYFIYDFCDLIINRKVLKMWELSLHHIAVISIFIYNLSMRTCIGYNVVALLTEVNSIFLHLRKLMQMLQVSFNGPAYRTNAVLNLASFLVFRGFCLARITYGMVAEWRRLQPAYLALLGGAMLVMNMINPALFVILFKNDILRKSKTGRRKDASTGEGFSSHKRDANGKLN